MATALALRDACADERRVPGSAGQGFREGDAVRVERDGAGECAGWALAAAADGREGWVRLRYLSQPDWPAWAGDVREATWRDWIATWSSEQQACARAALSNADWSATGYRKLFRVTRNTADWTPRVIRCITAMQAMQMNMAIDLEGMQLLDLDLDLVTAAMCMRPFTAELAALDHSQLFAAAPFEASTIRWAADGVEQCWGDALATKLAEALDLVGAARSQERSCIRERLHDAALREGADDDGWLWLASLCAPRTSIDRSVPTLGWHSDKIDRACLEARLTTEQVVALAAPEPRAAARAEARAAARAEAARSVRACADSLPSAQGVYDGAALTLTLQDGSSVQLPAGTPSADVRVSVEARLRLDLPPPPDYSLVLGYAWGITVDSLGAAVPMVIEFVDPEPATSWFLARHTSAGWVASPFEINDGIVRADLPGAGIVAIWVLPF